MADGTATGRCCKSIFPTISSKSGAKARGRASTSSARRADGVEVLFRVGAEACLPAVLASMASKYLRELSMLAVNDFWRRRVPSCGPRPATHRRQTVSQRDRRGGPDTGDSRAVLGVGFR